MFLLSHPCLAVLYVSVALPYGAMGWSAVCYGGIY